MSIYRNPFRMRASEKIEVDSTFLRLYSPFVIELLIDKAEKEELWNRVLFIQSSPGGGKTSLLRLFHPPSLNMLNSRRSNPYYKKIIKLLERLGVFQQNRVDLLGITLSCARNYSILEDIPIQNEFLKKQLFFSLLDSRIILNGLRAILSLKKLNFPDDLDKIAFSISENDEIPFNLSPNCSGVELYEWAESLERNSYSVINGNISAQNERYNHQLYSIFLFRPENFKVKGKHVASKFIIMLDDAHKLSLSQRNALKSFLIEGRANISIWIAERLEALSPEELVSLHGAKKGRDYEVLNLEEYWSVNYKKFENILIDIAKKRVSIAKDIQVQSFEDCLVDMPDEIVLDEEIKKAEAVLLTEIKKIQTITNKFDNWFDSGKTEQTWEEMAGLEKVRELQRIKILMERNLKKRQLAFDFALPSEELAAKGKTEIKNAAELFLSNKFSIPYYYGIKALAKVSFSNIEQFLAFSTELFDEISAKNIMGKQIFLSAIEQQRIIEKTAKDKWDEISNALPMGDKVEKFLLAFGQMAQEATNRPNAPYAPGVNGIGIKETKHLQLIKEDFWLDNPAYKELINVLAICVANNLIKIELGKLQGQKGQKWTILYLNRWLCVKFKLPLNYGGWQGREPKQLLNWIK